MSNGIILKTLRESSNLSQKELSDLSGVSKSFISEIETGKKGFSEDTFDKLSGSLVKFIDKSYVAGLYDRKSSLSILKVHKKAKKGKHGSGWVLTDGYIARVEFHTKHKILADFLAKVFDFGTVSTTAVRKEINKPFQVYTYMCWSKNAERLLTELLPYLKLKRKQAELILKLTGLQTRGTCGGKSFKVKIDEDEFVSLCLSGYGATRLARHFNISESTASNYKKRWVEGIEIQGTPIEERQKAHIQKAEQYEQIYQELKKIKKVLN